MSKKSLEKTGRKLRVTFEAHGDPLTLRDRSIGHDFWRDNGLYPKGRKLLKAVSTPMPKGHDFWTPMTTINKQRYSND